jgi:hypothetical protein
MNSSAMDGTRFSFVTMFRNVIPREVFGANDEAKVTADACFLLRNGINRQSRYVTRGMPYGRHERRIIRPLPPEALAALLAESVVPDDLTLH